MDGLKFATRIEEELRRQQISKGEFYDAVDITATAMYGWKRGAEPKKETIAAVEKYLGITFSDVSRNETTGMDANADVQKMKDFFATSNATENATA